VSFAITAYLAYVCTHDCPTDILVLQQREYKIKNEDFEPTWEDTNEAMDLYCNICSAYVQVKTKHCGPCNRCCEEFDHHCKWLNNCIGTINYKNFRRVLVSYLVFNCANVLLMV